MYVLSHLQNNIEQIKQIIPKASRMRHHWLLGIIRNLTWVRPLEPNPGSKLPQTPLEPSQTAAMGPSQTTQNLLRIVVMDFCSFVPRGTLMPSG